jgi:hypothetical protein
MKPPRRKHWSFTFDANVYLRYLRIFVTTKIVLMTRVDEILGKETLEVNDIVYLLQTGTEDRNKLYAQAAKVKEKYIGKKVYFRGAY